MGLETGLGYVAAVVVGLTLGLLGSGGSILTVPVFAYLFHVPGSLATTYSLFVVGFGALVGAIQYGRGGYVDTRALLAFGIPSSIGMFLTRGLLVPSLPQDLLTSPVHLTLDHAVLILFGGLMLMASVAMFRPMIEREDQGPRKPVELAAFGLVAGSLMGIVGAGGGFLIVPALTVLAGLNIRKAAGTSLSVIALNSTFGFASAATRQPIEWPLVLTVAALTAAGIGVGTYMAGRVKAEKLKRGFAWLVLGMAFWVLGNEVVRFWN